MAYFKARKAGLDGKNISKPEANWQEVAVIFWFG